VINRFGFARADRGCFRRYVKLPLFQMTGETPVTNRFSTFEIPHNASLWSKVSTRLPHQTLG
jgi:hypothetical protein